MKLSDTQHFLKKELKALATKRGDMAIPEQETFDDKKTKKVKVKSKTKK